AVLARQVGPVAGQVMGVGIDLEHRVGKEWRPVTAATLDRTDVRSEQHRIPVEDAIAAYLNDAAWLTGEPDRRGQPLPGYGAGLCVPTLDPFACSPEELPHIVSDLTVMGGRITHGSGDLAGA